MLIPPQLNGSPNEPNYSRIYRYLKESILRGQIPAGAKLPSIRALALHLGMSRNPVETAYAQLAAEGFILGRAKSGYYAAEIDGLDVAAFGLPAPAEPQRSAPPTGVRSTLAVPEAAVEIDFSPYGTDWDRFPLALWKKLSLRILRTSDRDLFGYGDHRGEAKLRSLVCEYLRGHRGVLCRPEQVILTSGTQQSAAILSSLLRDEPGALGVEAAMHPGLHAVFRRHGLNPVPLPLEADGLGCDRLPADRSLRGIYVTPSHQFPYGTILPAAKRMRLLQWAAETQSYIIEDDYDSEFRYEGKPLPALQGLDQAERVIYLGTFSKALAPAIRLSYLVLPPALLRRFERDYANYDQTASRLTQRTMELFMEQGHLERHIRRMRKVYREKRDALIAAIRAGFQGKAAVLGAASGLHLMLRIGGLNSQELLRLASERGVRVYPVEDFHVDGRAALADDDAGASYFVLGYGGLTLEQIRDGIERLSAAWRQAE